MASNIPTLRSRRNWRAVLSSLRMVSDIGEEQYADLAMAANVKGNL
jgi:hypothetical protein